MVFVVKSSFAIRQVVIERESKQWPDTVMLRLHVKGLVCFRASHGEAALDAAAAIQEGKVKLRLGKDAKENALLDQKSPFWTAIRTVGGDGKPATELPLKDGYFEVTLPRVFFEANPKSIILNWIDCCRN
jgi:hypothetical protein